MRAARTVRDRSYASATRCPVLRSRVVLPGDSEVACELLVHNQVRYGPRVSYYRLCCTVFGPRVSCYRLFGVVVLRYLAVRIRSASTRGATNYQYLMLPDRWSQY
eukprot:3162938-Rhodomonas_salina.1